MLTTGEFNAMRSIKSFPAIAITRNAFYDNTQRESETQNVIELITALPTKQYNKQPVFLRKNEGIWFVISVIGFYLRLWLHTVKVALYIETGTEAGFLSSHYANHKQDILSKIDVYAFNIYNWCS